VEESKYEWVLVTDAEIKLVNKLLFITEVVKADVIVAMDAVVLISDDSDVVETDETFVEEFEVEVVKIVAVEVNMVGESIFAE
jgi:hypothetical protein